MDFGPIRTYQPIWLKWLMNETTSQKPLKLAQKTTGQSLLAGRFLGHFTRRPLDHSPLMTWPF